MHPPVSIIVFTTAAGAGYGLLFLLGVMAPVHLLPDEGSFAIVALLLGLGLVTVGLAASPLHLGRPEQAWHALSQWRSSWLSREGVAAMITYGPAAVLVVSWGLVGSEGPVTLLAGALTALGAVVTVICMGMIYASRTSVRQWHNGWVVPNDLVIGLMIGAVLLNVLMHLWGGGLAEFDLVVALVIALSVLSKEAYWDTIERLRSPHPQRTDRIKETGARLGRTQAARLRGIARLFGFTVPLLATTLALLVPAAADPATVLAALSMLVGMAVERWLFFAEARHAVQVPYGARKL